MDRLRRLPPVPGVDAPPLDGGWDGMVEQTSRSRRLVKSIVIRPHRLSSKPECQTTRAPASVGHALNLDVVRVLDHARAPAHAPARAPGRLAEAARRLL